MAKSRGMFILIILLASISLAGYQFFFNKKEGNTTPKDKPLYLQSANDAFTLSMNHVVEDYLALKDAFVQSDTAAIRVQAGTLSLSLDSIAWNELKADSNLVTLARSLQKDMQSACQSLLSAADLKTGRHAFQTCSDLLFDLLRSVQYKGAKLFQAFCPMAFDNAGANWLSASREIFNPYFGSKMLHCGEVKDSISFAQ
jgi:hypothetical protein